MMYHFLAGVVAYAVSAAIVYIPAVKSGPYYFPIGLACALGANVVWLRLVRQLDSAERILIAGFWWDGMTVVTYTLVPLLLFGVRLRWKVALGMALTAVGIMLTKL